ncbi:hypothetical protein V5O48_008337 [Marasmius crinis-equi]|uniref:ubiquitinyl hydrolase 1 n=1 Tax=Marasmius crinis-equi TaxID=585013 RepID=A0ABR3FEV0_9AGAR
MQTSLDYLVNHIFFPPKLRKSDDFNTQNEHDLCSTVLEAAQAYQRHLPEGEPRWSYVVAMLKRLSSLYRTKASFNKNDVLTHISNMEAGDVTALLIGAQNAGLIIRRFHDESVFELFEVSPPNEKVMGTPGKLVCSYPGPAITVPSDTSTSPEFISSLSDFLSQMHAHPINAAMPTTKKAGSEVEELRNTPSPRFVTELLTGILRGYGTPADVTRISKRIADDVVWDQTLLPWRRSPMWLVIRVALQTTLHGAPGLYKSFLAFLMSDILRKAVKVELNSDTLSIMSKKLARRVYKIRNTAPESLQSDVLEAVTVAQDCMRERWDQVQRTHAHSGLNGWEPQRLNVQEDTALSLDKSKEYILSALDGRQSQRFSSSFAPNEQRRLKELGEYSGSSDLKDRVKALGVLALFDFERAVEIGIDGWIDEHWDSEDACSILSGWMSVYHKKAFRRYEGNPQEMSVMFLTLLELWIGLDKLCVNFTPLLREYSPEVPESLFEPLLLARRQSIDRLRKAIEYLRRRNAQVVSDLPSIYSPDAKSSTSFPIRFYDESDSLQKHRVKIEERAARDREEKIAELEQQNELYHERVRQAETMECDTAFRWGSGYSYHPHWCNKCELEKLYSSMTIQVHEWPLPAEENGAKATVFEIACPTVFGIWRRSTYSFLRDMCFPSPLRKEAQSPSAEVILSDYRGLAQFRDKSSFRRLTFASTTKSWVKTHYQGVSLPTTSRRVCLKNGLRLSLFDTKDEVWISDPFDGCTYTVDTTSHTSNEVIANQSVCDLGLSLHEYTAFGTLRAGSLVQWHNILREIRAGTLTFSEEAVEMLITQTALQMGPLSRDARWEWHENLYDDSFCFRLLEELEALRRNVQANWSEDTTMRIAILLAHRILNWHSNVDLRGRVFSFLDRCRTLTYDWMKDLAEKLQKADDCHTAEFQLRLWQVAATVRSTFDSDISSYSASLTRSPFRILLESGMVLRDNMPPKSHIAHVERGTSRIITHDHRFAHSVEEYLAGAVVNSDDLHHAILNYWPAYHAGSEWVCLGQPNDRWARSTGNGGQQVDFNVLESQLLVEGKPLSRLPSNYMSHSTYSRIFGKIFFALPVSGDLVIRARNRETSEYLELVPHEKLRGDLPETLVDGFTHWLRLGDGVMECRPLTNMWASDPANWRINFLQNPPHMWKGSLQDVSLVDVRSGTTRMIATRLRYLEQKEFIVITHSQDSEDIIIDLPRYRLLFRLDPDGELVCLTFPDMIVDSDQSAKTLIGLQTRLILRDRASSTRRELLVPVGEVDFSADGHHTCVTVGLGGDRIRYFRYVIDERLGRLVGITPALHAMLYRVYLTALTSHPLPDPLTGRTGTEEALKDLRSASFKSFMSLDMSSQRLLHRIAELSPRREYYPVHLKVMQTVHWNALPTLAQHNEFFFASQAIADFAIRLQIFSDEHSRMSIQGPKELPCALLVKRAASRNRWYYLDELHTEISPDCRYLSRDIPDKSEERAVSSDAALVKRWPSNPSVTKQLLQDLQQLSEGVVGGLKPDSEKYFTPDVQYLIHSPLSGSWIRLYSFLRSESTNHYQVAFTLCTLGYAHRDPKIRRLLPTLIAFASRRADFRRHSPPSWESYRLGEGFEPDKHRLIEKAHGSTRGFQFDDYSNIPRRSWDETDESLYSRRLSRYEERKKVEVQTLVQSVMGQWPCLEPRPPSRSDFSVVQPLVFIDNVKPLFSDWYHNRDLKLHIDKVQTSLNIIGSSPGSMIVLPTEYSFLPCPVPGPSPRSSVSLHLLMKRQPTEFSLPPANPSPCTSSSIQGGVSNDLNRLDDLVEEFQDSADPIHRTYAEHIEQSLEVLREARPIPQLRIKESTAPDMCSQYQRICGTSLEESLETVQTTLGALYYGDKIMEKAGLWPCLSLRSILESMASTNTYTPPKLWMKVIINLARTVLLYQRARRLSHLARLRKWDDLQKELNIDVSVLKIEDCDWLLIQANSDFLVRKVQLSVAEEMRVPSSGGNTVLQLNMGEGKSSVIVPFLATQLADGHQLMRVVVLKSLSRQMFSILLQRLGGLTNRQVLYLPFSRDVKIGMEEVSEIQCLYEEAIRSRAVIVAQPEHLLSFKLMAVDQLVGQSSIAPRLIRTQQLLDNVSRDVLDESDEILHTRYQLIYTVGHQQTLEHGSERWTTILQILSLVGECASSIAPLCPKGLTVDSSTNGFPYIRILQTEAGTMLIADIVKRVMGGELPTCYFERFADRTRDIIERFIQDKHISPKENAALERECSGSALWKNLLLLRGLLGQGILAYVLGGRRWRVDFGLDLSRSQLAVPYRAKDVPSLRAEFGHPDVAILLTCLSYLYGGLSQANIDTCFDLLFKLDNPALEYDSWIRSAQKLPEGLRSISGVNLKDAEQKSNELFPLFRTNPSTIQFYLSNVVFPKAAKEFPKKLSTTGWDIACRKKRVVTGFSGTNDNRYLLPTSIVQADTPDRQDTNAKMLSVLLAPENDQYEAPSAQALTGREIIDTLVDTTHRADIRVLLDVGAQILEMTNSQVAKYWLSRRQNVSAAVFFDERDELEVMTRDGATELLSLSPFHDHFDDCVVYLDDAHTRGTDLRLPTHWKACVTLGPKVTKDRLAQGCMRMRKLGRGQSVMFMAPNDVDTAIRKQAKKTSGEAINSLDVIRWAMSETCAEIAHHIPHWVQQGVDFQARDEGWKELADQNDHFHALDAIRSSWLQPEARTLEDMYGFSPDSAGSNDLTQRAQAIPDIWERCKTLGVTSILDPRVEEEQEREVSHEIEREPQIERPPKAKPAVHRLHPDVTHFVMTGCLRGASPAFDRAFLPMRDGSDDVRKWELSGSSHLLATRDFLKTIESTTAFPGGDYLRPLNWVVSGRHTSSNSSLVVMSPYEVNQLLPVIRKGKAVRLHIYTPRITQSMRPTDDLEFYTIPSSSLTSHIPRVPVTMIDQLNLCAGQLYFSDYDEYRRISAILGICTPEDRGYKAEHDGFVKPENRGRGTNLSAKCRFEESPLAYLKLLIGFRRKGITFEPTHMGKILHTRFLREDDI